MNLATRISILITSSIILAGPWYAEEAYRVVSDSISELGTQQSKNNWILKVGFLVLGAGLLFDFIRTRRKLDISFALFGLFFALSGLYPHKPSADGVPYHEVNDILHSVMANIAGVALSVGLCLRAMRESGHRHVYALVVAMISIVVPLAMWRFPAFTGLLQRSMFAAVFVWLWFNYPIQDDRQAV